MKRYKDKVSGQIVVEVDDLSFLGDRYHRYNWFQRHFHHHRLRIKVKGANKIFAASEKVATDIHRFYFIPYDRITIKHSNHQ
jgi:hypothetical protein